MTFDVAAYWETRYAKGLDSGAGSRGEWAQLKADYVNDLIARERVTSVIDWGCGDGAQAVLLTNRAAYTGVDVSDTALRLARRRRSHGAFRRPEEAVGLRADMALSMDVIYHLPDEDPFLDYLTQVFTSANRLVCVHCTDEERRTAAPHWRGREWTSVVRALWPWWKLVEETPTGLGHSFRVFRLSP
jgi:SAM-dependent methyltransferase